MPIPAPTSGARISRTPPALVRRWRRATTASISGSTPSRIPTSPIYQALLPHSGDFEVWGGLVPDFLRARSAPDFRRLSRARALSRRACRATSWTSATTRISPATGLSRRSRGFPPARTASRCTACSACATRTRCRSVFEKRRQRTYGLVRSSGALAAPYPYVLYSDLYDHKEFIRGLVNIGLLGAALDSRIARTPATRKI